MRSFLVCSKADLYGVGPCHRPGAAHAMRVVLNRLRLTRPRGAWLTTSDGDLFERRRDDIDGRALATLCSLADCTHEAGPTSQAQAEDGPLAMGVQLTLDCLHISIDVNQRLRRTQDSGNAAEEVCREANYSTPFCSVAKASAIWVTSGSIPSS
jgi:hypothetical protein